MELVTEQASSASASRGAQRRRWPLTAAAVVVALAAVGVWNPRDYVLVDELLNHPFVAAVIAVALLIAALVPISRARHGALQRATPPLLVAMLVAALLVLGWALEDEHFEGHTSVAGTELFVDVRSFGWWDGGEQAAYLYIGEGSGPLRRRVLVGESEHVYDDTELRALLVGPGHLRVVWHWTGSDEFDEQWDIWFSPDTLSATRVESTSGCAGDFPVECVEVSLR